MAVWRRGSRKVEPENTSIVELLDAAGDYDTTDDYTTMDIDVADAAADEMSSEQAPVEDPSTEPVSGVEPEEKPFWKKIVGPAGWISGSAGLGLGASEIPGLNGPVITHSGGLLLVLSAAAVLGRSIVHTWQLHELARPSRSLRVLNIADYVAASAPWTAVAYLALTNVNSPVLPKLVVGATAALWIVAGLQGLVIRAHRSQTIEGEKANTEVRFGTDSVRKIKIIGGVTIADLAAQAPRTVGRFFRVPAIGVFSVLATVVITGGFAFAANHWSGVVGSDSRRRAEQDGQAPSKKLATAPTGNAARKNSPTSRDPARNGSMQPRTKKPKAPEKTTSARATPSARKTPSYNVQCVDRGQEPGMGGPSWSVNLLNDAWFGPGAGPAGCAQKVHVINNRLCPTAWEEGVDEGGQVVSIAVASKCSQTSAIFLDNSAVVVEGLVESHYAVSGSCRRSVGDGDVQLIYGQFGTIALVRADRNNDTETVVLPPAGTSAWQQIIAATGGMVWPSTISVTTFEFDNASGGDKVGTVHVNYTGSDPELAMTGTLATPTGTVSVQAGRQTLTGLTPGAPAVCH